MRVVRVEAAEDPRLDDYLRLTDVALRRRVEPARGLYIAESSKVIARALEAGHRPRSVLTGARWLDDILGVLERGGAPDSTAVYLVDEALLAAVTGFAVHRGALAAMQRPELPDAAALLVDARLVVVLEDLVEHANVGAVFRSVAGLGADAVLVGPRCADPLYRRAVRVSMGTVFQVPWTRIPDWRDGARELLHAAGFTIAALALADDAVPLRSFAQNASDRVALVLGAEGDGLSAAAIAAADAVVTIPMAGGVDSLNVAAASAVAVYALAGRG